jgi:hypothetical protein
VRKAITTSLLLMIYCGVALGRQEKHQSHPATHHKGHGAPKHKGTHEHGAHKSHPAPSHAKRPSSHTKAG